MTELEREPLPLQGKRILVTRTREQAGMLSERLQALGALAVEFPTIRIAPPTDWTALDTALARLFSEDEAGRPYYAWLVFTSVNGVNICCQRMRSLAFDLNIMRTRRIAAIGPATAAALEQYSLHAEIVPGEYVAEGVATSIIEDAQRRGESLQGMRILLARAAEARKVLAVELQQVGALVDDVAAYDTRTVDADDERGRAVAQSLRAGELDYITFTSSSTVKNFMRWLISEPGQLELVTRNALLKLACIGPITARSARELGLTVHIEARTYTIDGLVAALVENEKVQS